MNCTGQGFTADGSGVGPDLREREADDDGGMIAAAMVAPTALYMDMRRVRCGPFRRYHVRGMNPLEKRSRPTLIRRGL